VLHLVSAPGQMEISMPPAILAETLAAAALIGILSAWFPARAASRMNITEALRTVA